MSLERPRPVLLSVPTVRDAPHRFRDERVPIRARELPLQAGARIDELGASNARLRRLTATYARTSGSTSRAIAWFVAWNDHTTSPDAVEVVSSGVPGSARRSRSAADLQDPYL